MAQFSDSGNSYVLSGILNPLQDTDAANKRYVDDAVANRRPIFANHYLRNYATDRNWVAGDLVYVTGRAYYIDADYVLIGLDSRQRTQIFVYNDDTETIKQVRDDWLTGSGRRVANASLTHQDTVLSVGSFELSRTLPDGTHSSGYLVTLQDTDQPSGSNNPYAEYANLAVEEDAGFRTGTYEYVGGTQNNNARTVDGDWSFQSSEVDHFGVEAGPVNIRLTDEAGDTAIIPAFGTTTAGVVRAPGVGRNDSDHFLAGDGRFYPRNRSTGGGGGITYTAGFGLDLTGNQFSVDSDVMATRRFVENQPAGENTTYAPGFGLNLTDTEFSVDTDVMADVAFVNDGLNDIRSSIDSWIGGDTTYQLVVGADPDKEGTIRLGRIVGLDFADRQSAGEIFQIRVQPRSGTHAAVLANMTQNSPVKITQGNAEYVATLSAAPSVSGNLHTFRFNNASIISSQLSFDTESPNNNVTFRFRPAVENPVITGDIEPDAVIGQSIAGASIGPFHLNPFDTSAAALKKRGYVAVLADSENARDTGFLFQRKEPYGAADAVRDELDRFKERVAEGIGEIPVTEDSELRRPREFTSINFRRSGDRVTGVTFGYLDHDTDAWSALDDFFDDELLYAGSDVTIHMQVSYQPSSGDTELTDVDFFINTTLPGGAGILDLDRANRLATFQINTTNASSVIALDDTHGNASAIPPSDFTGGNGYWRNIHMYDGLGEYADLTSQFREIGDPVYNYARVFNTTIPVIIDNDDQNTPHIRLAGLGAGLRYDSDANEIYINDTDHSDVLRWDTTITGDRARLIPSGNAANGAYFGRSDTIGWFVPDVNDSTQVDAFVRSGSIDSDLLDTDSVHIRHIAAVGTPGSGTYLRGDGQWAAVSGGGEALTAGFGINIAENVASVDTDLIVDVAYLGNSASQFTASRYGTVSSVPSSDDLATRFLNAQNNWVTIHEQPNGVHVFTDDSDGLVPAPRLFDSDSDSIRQYTLRADGRWIELPGQEPIFTANRAGLVPPPGQADEALFLTAAGHWRHTEEFIDSDLIVRALDTLVSEWDTDNNSIELGTVVRIPGTPGRPASEGSYAEYVITFTQDGADNIVHDGAEMRFTCPRRQTLLHRNYDSETDYVDVALTNPNINGFAYPPTNALGLRDVVYAMLDPNNHADGHTPWDDWIELNRDASDAIRGSDVNRSQLVIGVSTQNPAANGAGRQGSVDTDTFVRSTLLFNGGQSSDFHLEAEFYVQDGTPQTGSWPTRSTPDTPARDTEILILDQQIPIFGTTEQGNTTREPGLVPEPRVGQADTDYYLTGRGTWHHVREITRDTEHEFTRDHAGVVPAYGPISDDDTQRYELTPNGWQPRRALDTDDEFDAIAMIDAFGKSANLTWGGGLLRRVVKQVWGAQLDSYTLVLNWTGTLLTSVDYYIGDHRGTGALPDQRIGEKLLTYNTDNTLADVNYNA